MTRETLLKIINAIIKSHKANNLIDQGFRMLSDHCSTFAGDFILRQELFDIIEDKYGENAVEVILHYMHDGEYVVIDWSKVPADEEGNKKVFGSGEEYKDRVILNTEDLVDYIIQGK